ncbi:MAG: hypothetical protein AAGA30_20435, partial [Planctomycetota bacterium]
LVGSLVGYAIASIGFNQLEEILTEDPDFFSDEQLAGLQERIEAISFEEWTHVEGERAFLLDVVQRIYSDDGDGDGRITPEGLNILWNYLSGLEKPISDTGDESIDSYIRVGRQAIAPAALFVMAGRKETVDIAREYYQQYETAKSTPFWEREPIDMEEFLDANATRYAVLANLLPAFNSVIGAMDRLIGRQEGVLAALAAHRYYLKNKQWPASIMDCSPEFCNEVSIDIVNGNHLLMKIDEIGPVFYSVGLDKDDDGGVQVINKYNAYVAAAQFNTNRDEPEGNGDWIVWPQERYSKRGRVETQ